MRRTRGRLDRNRCECSTLRKPRPEGRADGRVDPRPMSRGIPQSAVCAARTSSGRVRGLGSASASYTWALDAGPPTCAAGEAKVLGYPVAIDVAGKGALMISVAELGRCVAQEPSRNEPQSFTIVGGTGLYAGASGQGTVERLIGQTSSGASGRETWTASMNVPGLEFDVVAPVITVTAPKPVRCRRRPSEHACATAWPARCNLRRMPVVPDTFGAASRSGDRSTLLATDHEKIDALRTSLATAPERRDEPLAVRARQAGCRYAQGRGSPGSGEGAIFVTR